MRKEDLNKFQELINSVGEYYQLKEPISKMSLQIYASALSAYEYDHVRQAFMQYISHGKNAHFFPKASDITLILDGGDINAETIIAAARSCDSVLGILARIHIGSHDLLITKDHEYLRTRAKECIAKLDEWRAKASAGGFTAHELAVMRKHGVKPRSSLYSNAGVVFDDGGESKEYLRLTRPQVDPLPDITDQKKGENKSRISEIIRRVFSG